MMTNNTIGTVLGTVLDLGLAWYWYVTTLAVMVLLSSLVLIRERQAGIVVKRFAGKSLEPGHLIALAGEQRKTYEVQEAAQKQRQQLVRQTSLADIQQEVWARNRA